MALTNFAALTTEQKTVWSRDVWRQAREHMFLSKFMGDGANSMVQRISELTKDERGTRAVLTLVAELEEDGTAGDTTLEGNEEKINAYDQVIQIDQLRHANRTEGRVAEQKSIVRFRETSRDMLAYWLAERTDQLAFLTLSGVAYTNNTDLSARSGSGFANLAFSADVTAPSTNRYYNWDASAGAFVAGNTATVAADDTPSYEMLVKLKALAHEKFIRPIRINGGVEMFHVFMHPDAFAELKLDSDFLTNVRQGMPRADSNQLFKGTKATGGIYVDGLMIHEYRNVINTKGLVSGSTKWGSGNTVEGNKVLLCGAQALGYADLGMPYWVEKKFDYENQLGISVGKFCGMLKPVFHSNVDNADEDFGVLTINTAM